MSPTPEIKALLDKLRAPEGRISDAIALARRGSEAVPYLIELTRDSEARIRGQASFALGQVVPPATTEIRDALVSRLGDEDHQVRWVAVRSLGALKVNDPDVLARLEAARRSDANDEVRNAAGEAILEVTGKAPAPLRDLNSLLAALGSANAADREVALNEIGLLGIARDANVRQDRVLKALADRLTKDDYFQCRSSAALALQRIAQSPPFIVDSLIKALDDKDARVQAQAVAALGSFGPPAASALPKLKATASGATPLAEEARRAVSNIGAH